MDFGPLMNKVLVVFSFCWMCAFLFQRIRWKYRNRRGKKNSSFIPRTHPFGMLSMCFSSFPNLMRHM